MYVCIIESYFGKYHNPWTQRIPLHPVFSAFDDMGKGTHAASHGNLQFSMSDRRSQKRLSPRKLPRRNVQLLVNPWKAHSKFDRENHVIAFTIHFFLGALVFDKSVCVWKKLKEGSGHHLSTSQILYYRRPKRNVLFNLHSLVRHKFSWKVFFFCVFVFRWPRLGWVSVQEILNLPKFETCWANVGIHRREENKNLGNQLAVEIHIENQLGKFSKQSLYFTKHNIYFWLVVGGF